MASPSYAAMYGATYYNRANYFDSVVARSTSGGIDLAKLYDSPGDDLSDLTALARVKAISSKGGTDTRHAEATDYVLETQGPWTPI